MTHFGSQDIAISRLRVRGDKRIAESLAREFAQASWPLQLPASVQQAWIMVRELRVNGYSQSLRQQSAQQLENVLLHAVDGKHASDSSSAVSFKSLPELLAFLLRDIAQGNAAGKWYWQRWSGFQHSGREDAVAQLLCENIIELPAIVNELAAMGKLRLVWETITSTTALTLIKQLARHYQFDNYLTESSSDGRHLEKNMRLLDVNSSVEQQLQLSASRQFQQQGQHLHSWLSALSNIPRTDYRWQFAALISGISLCPLLVIRSPAAVTHAFFYTIEKLLSARELTLLDNQVEGKNNSLGHNDKSSFNDNSPHGDEGGVSDQLQLDTHRESKTKVSDISKTSNVKKYSQFGLGDITETEIQNTEASNPVQATLSRQSSSISKSDDAQVDSDALIDNSFLLNAKFVTRCGGFFYLINTMRPFITADFLANQTQATGWLWVFDCARLLANKVGVEFDLPLLQFVKNISGIETVGDLTLSISSPESQQVFEMIEKRFSDKSFWSIENNLLNSPAQVVTTASHIDVYYSLDAVRLDIRLAGLDVNPGWVPWLGRVVTFHYMDSPSVTFLHESVDNQGESCAE